MRGLWRGNNTAIYLTLASPLLAHTLTTRAIGPLLERSGYNLRNTQLVITGAVATTVFALLYPLDLARTRLACDVRGVKERQFSGAVDVWRKVLQTDGIKGLYRYFDSSPFLVLFCFVLFCFVLFCFVLFCFVLFCFVLFCFVLFCFVLFCFVLFDFSFELLCC